MSILRCTLVAVVLLTPVSLEAQTPSARSYRLRIGDVMTIREQTEIGISKITPGQRAAFEAWLDRYTDTVFQVAKKRSESRVGPTSPASPTYGRGSPTYFGVGGGHWIETSGDGKIIALEDGSMWQINPVDQIDTAL